ncbi:unnamed protein product [Onchocerca flexuosa]|uniref:Ovule protein n=1 Tax=Onchocerca flexuosa TaxID=387005 RepID=A0A183I819_9BILA|nr:unnamed protein product [Onchocerca flexuosa]
MILRQSSKEECNLTEADGSLLLDAKSETKLETMAVSFNEPIFVKEDMSQKKVLVNYESEITDMVSNGETSKSTIDFVENMLPSGVTLETKSSKFVDGEATSTSIEQNSKPIFSERQPKQLQMKSRNEKLHIDLAESFEILSKEKSAIDQQRYTDKVIIQRRHKAGRRTHGSMGCADRNHLNKSNLGQSVVRMRYHSGTASS